jgi:serine phosphatase RsbU (regulator of sigma subunit)
MGGDAARLLVIDDDAVIRDSLIAYLERAGYVVEGAAGGREGLARFEANPPDLVLLDTCMAQMGGVEVLKTLKEHGDQVPVIVISGGGVMSDVVQALRHGASDYLIKPIGDMAVLEQSIERCLQQGRLRRENQRYRQQLEEANRELQQSLMLLQQDQQAGRHVQLKMLPATPFHIGPYEFSHRILPSLLLSGDLVDYYTVGDRHVVFFIADVSGHGASSAFVTVLLKNLFARKRSDYTHRRDRSVLSPPAMLERANRELLDTGIGKYATLCVCVLDLAENTLRYSVAGHLPTPVLCSEAGCRYLEGCGPPVGLFADAQYVEQRLELPAHFTLTLFSDGVLEMVAADGLIAREAGLLERLTPAVGSVDAVLAALGLQGAEGLPDDVAVLMVRRSGGDSGSESLKGTG